MVDLMYLTLSAPGPSLYAYVRRRRQILTYTDEPSTERIQIFMVAVDS